MTCTSAEPRLGLNRIAILRDVASERLEKIGSECRWCDIAANQCVIRRGHDDRTLFLVVSGSVRLVTSSRNGRNVTCIDRTAGDFFGALPALAHGDYACDAYALEPTALVAVPWATFDRWLVEERGIAMHVIERLSADVVTLFGRVAELSTSPVGARLNAEVLRLAHASGSERPSTRIETTPRNAVIAAAIGTNPEEVSRALARLARRGFVRRDGRALVVPDLGALERLVRSEADAA